MSEQRTPSRQGNQNAIFLFEKETNNEITNSQFLISENHYLTIPLVAWTGSNF